MTFLAELSKESAELAVKLVTCVIDGETKRLHYLDSEADILALEVLRNELEDGLKQSVDPAKIRLESARETLLEVLSHEERVGLRGQDYIMAVPVDSIRAMEAALEDIPWESPEVTSGNG